MSEEEDGNVISKGNVATLEINSANMSDCFKGDVTFEITGDSPYYWVHDSYVKKILPKEEFTPKHITFHGKTTIVRWNDGSKTVVRCREDEEFHKENGFAAALTKKIFGSRSSFLNVVERNSVTRDYFTKEERKEKKRLKREMIEEKTKAEAEALALAESELKD